MPHPASITAARTAGRKRDVGRKFIFFRRYYYNIISEIDGLPWRLPDEIAFFVSCITGNGEVTASLCPRRFCFVGGATRSRNPGKNSQLNLTTRNSAGNRSAFTETITGAFPVAKAMAAPKFTKPKWASGLSEDGEATLIVGGTMVQPKTVKPREIRGTSIDGGEIKPLNTSQSASPAENVPGKTFTYRVIKVDSN
jgi:hypothetical protein